jgi:hypothetical protein
VRHAHGVAEFAGVVRSVGKAGLAVGETRGTTALCIPRISFRGDGPISIPSAWVAGTVQIRRPYREGIR